MAWDPTDYKDMLDDDWNDRHQELLSMLDDEFFGGVYIEEMLRRASKILGNNKVLKDTEFERMVNKQEADIEDLAKYLMDQYYLTPIGRKRVKMKNENKDENMRARTLNEDDFELWSDDEEDKEEDDEEDDKIELMAELSQGLDNIFQEAAERGLTFEIIQDLVAQSLDQIDWVDAGQM